MSVFICAVLCLFLSGDIEASPDHANLPYVRHLIKRQAPSAGSSEGHDTSYYSKRPFVSPDGEPYYEYQPPVSSGRGVSQGRQASAHVSIGGGPAGRQATSQVKIRGVPLARQAKPNLNVADPRYGVANPAGSTGPRGRTYDYPFGRERVQYAGSQTQGHDQQTTSSIGSQSQGYDQQATRSAASKSGADGVHWKKEALLLQRQYPTFSFPNGRSDSRSQQNDSSQVLANQQPSYNATAVQGEDLRRRHSEIRRKHEDERRRLEEVRRRLLDERRRHGEERKRQEEERRRQYYEQQQRANQQQPQARENNEATQPSVTRQEQPGLTDNRRQQQTDTRRRLPLVDSSSQQHHPRTDTTNQRGHQQVPNLSSSTVTSSAQIPNVSLPRHQLPAYNFPQGNVPYQQPEYRTNNSHYPVPNNIPHQQAIFSQGYTRQPGQVDPRSQVPQGSFSSYSSSNQQTGQGQAQGYPYQERRSNLGSSSVSSSSNEQLGQGQAQGYPNQERRPNIGSSSVSSSSSEQLGQGQAQGYPNQERRSNFGSSSVSSSSSEQLGQGHVQGYSNQERVSNLGASFSFEQQDNDSDCPDTGIDLRINGLDCQQAVQQYGGYLCYTHEYTSRDCCHVCKPRKQPQRTGCEYGDHAELCSSIAAADCYDLRNRYSCCQTCDRLRRNNLPEGCEYGDMTIRCENVRQNPGLCYIPDNQRLCCETCSQIRNATNHGCPWGDYNSNLCQMFEENTANVRINCYSQQRRKLCCQSCDRLREWASVGLPADCQYGDRPVIFTTSQHGRLTCSNLFTYFSLDECRTNEAVAINCCHTCHRLLNKRG